MFRFLTLVVCCGTLFLTCSFLQSDEVDETEPTAESLFDKLDQNEDGFLDPAESRKPSRGFSLVCSGCVPTAIKARSVETVSRTDPTG